MSPWPGGHHSSVGSAGQLHGGEVVDADLGFRVLEEVQGQAVHREVRILAERGERVLARAERVHEDAAGRARRSPRARAHLLHDEVEEALAVPHGKQGLGAVHAHGGAEPAVEFDDRGLGEGLARRVVADVYAGQGVGSNERVNRVLADESGGARLELPVVVSEDVDRGGVDPCCNHLVLGLGESGNAHIVKSNGRQCETDHRQYPTFVVICPSTRGLWAG